MSIDHLSELIGILLAVSLATERLVMIIRTPITWLNDESKDPKTDWKRRFAVQLLALAAAIGTTGFLAESTWDIRGSLFVGSGENPAKIPLLIVALLATGGSSFWKNMLGYTKAVRDARVAERNTQTERQLLESEKNRRLIQVRTEAERMDDALGHIDQAGQPQFGG